jgi:hypothetical protein
MTCDIESHVCRADTECWRSTLREMQRFWGSLLLAIALSSFCSGCGTQATILPGFGMTILIINGALECNRPTDARVQDRVDFFTRYANLLGTTVGPNLLCDAMKSL